VVGQSLMKRPVFAAICLAAAIVATPSAQTDLDALMSRVMARRDENWKKLQQYTLTEQETLQITAVGGLRIFGFEREYLWFPRAGFFVRSPIRADGVAIGEAERRQAEARWLRRSQRRERRTNPEQNAAGNQASDPAVPAEVEDIVRQSFEPEFIESMNFMKFKFDAGRYALVGREQLLDRQVLKIEYYPTLMFSEGRTRPNRELRKEDEKIEDKMNKVSLVTLWVDPAQNQILQYEFHNIDLDFLPARSLVRVDDLRASMRMSEPFPNVWLPASISAGGRMMLALGEVAAKYEIRYYDYRLPEVKAIVR
jgi:hypothetical protein